MTQAPDSTQPSKTARKARSAALQDLGERLLRLPAEQRRRLALPERLDDALDMLGQIHAFEGRRRQSQYVGKLMRRLSAEQVATIEQVLQEHSQGSAADVLRLHALEDWRQRLLTSDDALTQWVDAHPGTDVQQLRALVRQVRKDRAQDDGQQQAPAGAAPRKTRSWRLLYQFLRAHDDDGATPPGAAA